MLSAHGVQGDRPAVNCRGNDHRLRSGNFFALFVNIEMAQDQCAVCRDSVHARPFDHQRQ